MTFEPTPTNAQSTVPFPSIPRARAAAGVRSIPALFVLRPVLSVPLSACGRRPVSQYGSLIFHGPTSTISAITLFPPFQICTFGRAPLNRKGSATPNSLSVIGWPSYALVLGSPAPPNTVAVIPSNFLVSVEGLSGIGSGFGSGVGSVGVGSNGCTGMGTTVSPPPPPAITASFDRDPHELPYQ